MTIATVMLCES